MDFTDGYVLIIGAGGDVPSTIDDAEGVAEILRDPQRCAYPPEQFSLLIGEGATRKVILNALDDLPIFQIQMQRLWFIFLGMAGAFQHQKTDIILCPMGMTLLTCPQPLLVGRNSPKNTLHYHNLFIVRY